MKLDLPVGRCILAVSGGVDSMVLLDLLTKQKTELVIAHFNHGTRGDSKKDEQLVVAAATKYGLPVEVGRAKLGKNASEDTARKARYDFLEKTREKHKAKSIITAHHRDDMIETALLNVMRGTKRRGLTAIADNPKIVRPLLKYKKKDILKYAKAHKLKWHEDSTNKDERYLRNFLRPRIAKLPTTKLNSFSKQLEKTLRINRQIDKEITVISELLIYDDKIKRQDFIHLPADVGREVMHYWLKNSGLVQADKKLIDRAANFVKTGRASANMTLGKHIELRNTSVQTSLWKAKPQNR